MRRARLAQLVFPVAVVAGVVAGAVGPAPAGTAAPAPRVLVVADSVALGARDAILDRLGAAGAAVTFDGEVSRSTLAAADVVRAHGPAGYDVAVVQLGTNDGASPALFRSRIDRVMSELRLVPRVVWLTIGEFAGWVPAANAELRAATLRWPNLELADWTALARDPANLGPDGIHPSLAGREALADLVARHVGAWTSAGSEPYVTATGRAHVPRSRHGTGLSGPPVAAAASPAGGLWTVDAAGTVTAFGRALGHGSLALVAVPEPIVGIAAVPDGRGYWLAGAGGRVFAFGSARLVGDVRSLRLAAPIVGIAAAPDGRGYWLAARDGGVFALGTARFLGSGTDRPLGGPVVAIAATPDGRGYWLADASGRVHPFGRAAVHPDADALPPSAPIVAIHASPAGRGYWLLARDGAVYSFGYARFDGRGEGTTFAAMVRVPGGSVLVGAG